MYNKLIFDKHHIWHPYTSLTNSIPVYPIISAYNNKLILSNGKYLIDGMSSWWSVIHGYNNSFINNAIKNQIIKMSHVMFGGITHLPAIELSNRLINLTPEGLDCVFLADSGSVAIEIAIKMTLQYWSSHNKYRYKFLSLQQGYHGDTFAAMSVCDPINSYHGYYKNYLPSNIFINIPKYFNDNWNYKKDISLLSKLLDIYHHNLAGLIIEPIAQGVNGMKFYNIEYLYQIRLLCDYYKIILIVDEIATGFGRTGEWFACNHAGITPDIMCLGKSLTGGTITLSAVLTTRKIAEILSNSKSRCFMHGPTFMSNPLACVAANASISLLENENWRLQVHNISTQFKLGLYPLINHPNVKNVMVLGAIAIIETKKLISIQKIQKWFILKGVWIRPYKNFIYLVPSYTIDYLALLKIINVVSESLNIKDNFINK